MNAIEPEPIYDVAHLAHVELLTPDLDGSLGFFRDLLGMEETARAGGSVYLRGYEEQYHHSLKLTAAAAGRRRPRRLARPQPAGARAPRRGDRGAGLGRGWIDGDLGHGRAFRFVTPEGHPMEIFWEVEYAATPEGKGTALRNRPQRRPAAGVPVRRIDHLNLMVADTALCRDFMTDVLGFRERERVMGGPNVVASWLSVTNLSHDIALVPEPTPARGRFHHVALHYTSLQHLFDLAELAREAGIRIETGPGRHGIGGAAFLYLIEPGGNRIELMGDPGYMVFDPSWRTVVWDASEIATAVVWTGALGARQLLGLRHAGPADRRRGNRRLSA